MEVTTADWGDSLYSRTFERQVTEGHIRTANII